MSQTPFTKGSANQNRLTDIAQEIRALTIELERRLTVQAEADEEEYYSAGEPNESKPIIKSEAPQSRAENRTIEVQRRPKSSKQIQYPEFQVGHLVQITNKHRGNYGRVGEIIRRTRTTADVKLTNPDAVVNKWVTSLRHVKKSD